MAARAIFSLRSLAMPRSRSATVSRTYSFTRSPSRTDAPLQYIHIYICRHIRLNQYKSGNKSIEIYKKRRTLFLETVTS